MKTLNMCTVLWAAVAACGCLDLNLLDDMTLLDGGSGEQGEASQMSGSESGGEQGSESTVGGPPSQDPGDTSPPVIGVPQCGELETLENQVCIAMGPISASLRFVSDEPASISLTVLEGEARAGVVSEPWSTAHHAAVTGLNSDNDLSITITVKDINENASEFEIVVFGTSGHSVSITEVLADPIGPEPAQEFVEIVNFGLKEIDISGWMVDDNGDANGSLIPDGTILSPGQVGVLVSSSFDNGDTQDPSPHPEARTIVLESSVGSNGLKNSEAETVELYDEEGTLVSQYRGQAGNPKEGHSVIRLRAELPDGDLLAFDLEPNATTTPGQVQPL